MQKPILLIDNYDSFTYNLHYVVKQFVSNVVVVKNDKIDFSTMDKYDKILISPGPGIPDEAGELKRFINTFKNQKNILGVCLGLQAIVEVFGGQLKNLDRVYHGVATPVEVCKEDIIFHQIPKIFEAGRYHSWVMDSKACDTPLIEITAKDEQDEVMAIKIKDLSIRGVQFHPESILTPIGKQLLKNWVVY